MCACGTTPLAYIAHAYDSEVHSASPGGAGTPSVNPPRGGDGDATDPAAECMPCPDVPSAPDCLCEPEEEDSAVVQDGGTGGVGTGPRDDDDEAVEPEPAAAAPLPQATAVGVEALLRPASVAGKDPSKTELSCDDLLAIRRSPYTPQAGPQPLFIEWYYRCVYEPMVIKKTMAPKAIVWKRPPKETAGFGNQLRGEYGALVLAMVTQRLFLIDDQMMDFYFHSPPAVDWRFNTHKGLFKKPKTVSGGAWEIHMVAQLCRVGMWHASGPPLSGCRASLTGVRLTGDDAAAGDGETDAGGVQDDGSRHVEGGVRSVAVPLRLERGRRAGRQPTCAADVRSPRPRCAPAARAARAWY